MSDDLPIVQIPRDPDGAVRMTAEETAQLAPGAYRYETTPRPETLAEVIAGTWGWTCSDDILAMPELQAIRKALHDMAKEDRYAFGGITLPAESLADRGMPPSVVAWVLGGQP